MEKQPFLVRNPQNGDKYRITAATSDEAIKIAERDAAKLPVVTHTTKEGKGAILVYPDGYEVFASQGYSTSDKAAIDKIRAGAQPVEMAQSMVRQGVLQENTPAGRLTGPIVAGSQSIGLGSGSFIDELTDALFGGKSGEALRAIAAAQASERPLETFAVQAGVGVAEAYALALKFPQLAQLFGGKPGTDMIGRVGRSALGGTVAGVTAGGISGAGEAMPGENRLQAAGQGAAIGGAVGGVLGAASPVVGAGVGNVVEMVRRSDVPAIANALGISRSAASLIKRTIAAGGDINQAIASVRSAGDSGMLVDAGVASQALTDAAMSASPTASHTVRTQLSDRAKTMANELDRMLSLELGDAPLGPKAAVRQIAEKTKDERNRLYDAAYSQAIDYSSGGKGEAVLDLIQRIDAPILKSAFSRANARMKFEGVGAPQWKISVDDAGNVTSLTEMPNVVQLDYLKRALNAMAEDARDPRTMRLTDDGRLYASMAASVRKTLGDAAPAYNDATALGGDKIAEENAFLFGRDLLKQQTEIEDVFEELGGTPSASQTAALKQGMRQYLRKLLNDVRAVPSDPDIAARQLDAFLRVSSSTNARDKISAVLGDGAEDFLRQIDEVAQTSTVRAALATNSKTAQRQSIEEFAKEELEPGILGELMRGEPVQSTKSIVQAITGRDAKYTSEQRQQLFDEIAKSMVEKRGDAAVETLEIMRKALNGQIITSAENERLSAEIAATIYGAARRVATPQDEEMGSGPQSRVSVPGLLAQ